jgi:hypothetical protein
LQLLLATEDLKMMMEEVSGRQDSTLSMGENSRPTGQGTIDLKTFLNIMKKSSW